MLEIPCITCLCVLIARCEPKVVVLVQERILLSNEQMEMEHISSERGVNDCNILQHQERVADPCYK